eukprot:CAMPEP_0203911696 /NCGR_PEP_ID=MMETSP0359-20131031/52853_1 /ASSEMBLY_ACC=CAM_ASM_000338 /TAXON_ID=268821 /ORGANISM="Scrippsiella Hangoei, Strain SHTV-5" /LENGTH=60 /DNA_ID=CAMNT_0050837477 /DNA_START=106 /DNA_END=285 /DNA_ORIENTATION=+
MAHDESQRLLLLRAAQRVCALKLEEPGRLLRPEPDGSAGSQGRRLDDQAVAAKPRLNPEV